MLGWPVYYVTSWTDCSPCLTPLHGSSSRPRTPLAAGATVDRVQIGCGRLPLSARRSTVVPRRGSTSCGWRWPAPTLAVGRHRRQHSSFLRRVLPLTTAACMWQQRGPGTACRLVSRRHHLCPRSGASLRHYFLREAIPTVSTAHDNQFSSCAANPVFSFDVVRCPCSHFDITPPKSVLWMNWKYVLWNVVSAP